MLYCGKCGRPNSLQSYLCVGCGEILLNQVAYAQSQEGQPVYCPNCKTMNPPGTVVCKNCLTALPTAGGLIGAGEGGGRGGRVKLDASLFADEPAASKPKTVKGPSRLAQAAAKREQNDEDDTPDWLASLRDGSVEGTNHPAVHTSNTYQPPVETFSDQALRPWGAEQRPSTTDDLIPKRPVGTDELPNWLADSGFTPTEQASSSDFIDNSLEGGSATSLDQFEEDITPFQFSPAFEPEKPATRRQTNTMKGNTTDGLSNTIPEWLRDLTGGVVPKATEPEKVGQPIGNLTDEVETATPYGEDNPEEESIPDWLRDVTKPGKVPGRSFGDVEVERTLNFAFDVEEPPHSGLTEDLEGLPDLDFLNDAKFNPNYGLTNEEPDSKALFADETLEWPSFLTEVEAGTAATPSVSGLEPFTHPLENQAAPIFSENTTPDWLTEITGQSASPSETPAAQAANPAWGSGLAPWLQGLRPPALNTEADTSAANIGPYFLEDKNTTVTSEAATHLPETLTAVEAEDTTPAWLAEVATPAVSSVPASEELPQIGQIQERTTSTRSFSLRDMLHQTENLARPLVEEQTQIVNPTFEQSATSPVAEEPGEAVEAELPDWLQAQISSETESTPSLAQTNPETTDAGNVMPTESANEEPPGWLKDMVAGKPVSPVNTYGSTGRKVNSYTPMGLSTEPKDTELPDWLRQADQPETPVEAASHSSPEPALTAFDPYQSGGNYEDKPLFEPDSGVEPALFDQSATEAEWEPFLNIAEPAVELDSTPLFNDFNYDYAEAVRDGEVAPEQAQSEISGEDEKLLESLFDNIVATPVSTETGSGPNWLQEQPQETGPVLELPQDLPEWLRDAGPEAATALPELEIAPAKIESGKETSSTNTSFGLPGVDFLSDSDVPAWLRTASQQATPAPAASVATPAPETPDPKALPAWLRTVGSSGPATDEPNIEDLPTSLPFETGLPEVEVPPTLAGAGVLATLLRSAPTTVAEPLQTSRQNRFNSRLAVRYLTFLLLIGVVLLGLLSPIGVSRLDITPPVKNFYDTVEGLSANQKVLVVYDWEADKTGEMRPMAQAVTEHLMNKRTQLVTLSLNPQGPALAEQVNSELVTNPAYGNNQSGAYDYGKGYLNLGFVPGSEAAVSSLFNKMDTLNDYKFGRIASSYPIMSGLSSLSNFDLVVVLAGDESSVRTWVEQFGIMPGAKMLLGVPTSVGPVAQPYAFAAPSADVNLAGHLVRPQGLLVGLDGTTQYQQLLQDKGLPADTKINLSQRLTAQSLGALLLVLIIVIANIVYLARKRE